ncbi:MAG: (d)CMP kinase [Clostridiales Family XIII bacterium]|jgi:cytidylate kinase|nr:(d)CMP kinase [Clostridiales Family XIII bacterium]
MMAAQGFRVAIDGPSGAGKSTIAKILANELGIDYIDTGAMYRAIALKMLENGIDIDADPAVLGEMLAHTDVDFAQGKTLLDGVDVSDRIRTAAVTDMASKSSALPQVREKLVVLQRAMGEKKAVIMDGRDIGTNVFPSAEVKFFMTASPEERASRRWAEMKEKDPTVSFEAVLAAIEERDYNDSHRALNPLTKADDAIEIDTDGLDIESVTAILRARIESA